MKTSYLFLALFVALGFAYTAMDSEATPTSPTLPQAVSRPIVETSNAAALTPVYPAGKAKSELKRPGSRRPVAMHKAPKESPKSTRPGIRQELPRARSGSLLPRPGSDFSQVPAHVNYELGENRHDVEDRNTMRTRTHQELKQYRLIALQFNF